MVPTIDELINSDNFKDRIKAITLLFKIEDRNEIKKRIGCVLKLLYDKNLLVRINMIKSLKKLILKYPDEFEPLIPRIYALLYTKNKSVISNVEALIDAIPPQLIQKIVIDATNKLYSANGFDRSIGLLDLSVIAVTSPEYIKNSLPELIAVSINDKYELLQIFALAIFEEFRDDEMELIFHKLNALYPYYLIKHDDWSLDSEDYDILIHALVKRYFSRTTKDELKKILDLLNNEDILIKLLSIAILKKNAKTLWRILSDEGIKELIENLMKNLDDKHWTIKIVSLLSLAKILTSCNRNSQDWCNFINECFLRIVEKSDELLKMNFITKAYTLETLLTIYKKCDPKETKTKIEELIMSIEVGKIIKEHFISYFKGIPLITKIKREKTVEYLNPCVHPYVDEPFIKELRENMSNYRNIFREIELGLNSDDWIDRWVGAKLLGNALYALPSFVGMHSQLLKTLLTDSIWMTRSTTVWALRMINLVDGLNFTKDDYLDILEYVDDDWYWEVRWEYLMLFFEILNKNPEIFENDELKNTLLSTATTKYLTDNNHVIRKMSKYLLQKLSVDEYILEYFNKDHSKRLEILQKMIKSPILRKSAFIRIKTRLKVGIKDNNDIEIRRLLILVNGKYYKETAYILYELVLLYDKYDIARKMVDTIRLMHPEIIEYRMEYLLRMLNELIVVRRKIALRELKAYVDVGIPITEKILNKLKEMIIYDVVDDAIISLTIYILEKVGDNEAKQLVKEKREFIEMGHNYTLKLEEILDDSSTPWHNIYGLIEHMSEDKLLNLDSNITTKLLFLLKEDIGMILKVRIIDLINKIIKTDNENINKIIEENYEMVFDMAFELMNYNYHTISVRSEKFMRTLIIKYPLLFRRWIFKKLSMLDNNKKYIEFVKQLLNDPSPDIKLEGLYVVECLINRELSDTARSFIYEMLDLLDYERWGIKKKSLDLLSDLEFGGEEITEDIVCKIIKVLKYTDEDFKMYLLRLLDQLPPSKKYWREVLDILNEFKDSNDPYTAEIAKSIIKKYSGEAVGDIVYEIIKVSKYADDDFKIYLLKLLDQLPPSKKYCKEVLDVLNELKDSSNPHIAEIAKNIIKKYGPPT